MMVLGGLEGTAGATVQCAMVQGVVEVAVEVMVNVEGVVGYWPQEACCSAADSAMVAVAASALAVRSASRQT